MHLRQTYVDFADCDVQTKAGTKARIPAGRHIVTENQTSGGGVSIVWPGSHIEIDYDEWTRLIKEGLVREVNA